MPRYRKRKPRRLLLTIFLSLVLLVIIARIAGPTADEEIERAGKSLHSKEASARTSADEGEIVTLNKLLVEKHCAEKKMKCADFSFATFAFDSLLPLGDDLKAFVLLTEAKHLFLLDLTTGNYVPVTPSEYTEIFPTDSIQLIQLKQGAPPQLFVGGKCDEFDCTQEKRNYVFVWKDEIEQFSLAVAWPVYEIVQREGRAFTTHYRESSTYEISDWLPGNSRQLTIHFEKEYRDGDSEHEAGKRDVAVETYGWRRGQLTLVAKRENNRTLLTEEDPLWRVVQTEPSSGEAAIALLVDHLGSENELVSEVAFKKLEGDEGTIRQFQRILQLYFDGGNHVRRFAGLLLARWVKQDATMFSNADRERFYEAFKNDGTGRPFLVAFGDSRVFPDLTKEMETNLAEKSACKVMRTLADIRELVSQGAKPEKRDLSALTKASKMKTNCSEIDSMGPGYEAKQLLKTLPKN